MASSSNKGMLKHLQDADNVENNSQQGCGNDKDKGQGNSFKQEYHRFGTDLCDFKALDLEESLNFNEPCDWHPKVTVIVERVRFHCNPLLLNGYSRFILNMYTDDPDVISLPDGIVTPEQFAAIYDWILADNPEVSRNAIIDLYVGAKKLQVTELVEKCEACFENKLMFSEADAYILIAKMNAYELRDIQLMLLPRITRFFQCIISSSDFLKMNLDTVCLFLSSEHVGVNTEGDVLYAGILWLTEDWANRRQHVDQVMACVELCTVPPCMLFDVVCRPPPIEPSVELMRTDKKFVWQIFGGMVHNEFGNTKTGNTGKPLPKGRDKPLKLRRRIYDPDWRFHFKPDCDEPEPTTTFKRFLEFRDCVVRKGITYWETLKEF